MIRALVYSDLQATEGHEKCHADPTKSLQINRVNKLYADLFRVYTAHGCNALWDLGDTTDDRSALPVPAVNAVCEGLSRMPGGGVWDIKLIGNHEQYLRNTRVNAGHMFRPYFHWVVEQPRVLPVSTRLQVMVCPYPEDEAALRACIEQQRKPGLQTIMLGHFQIAGCYGCSGQLMTGVGLKDLAWLKLGLLGHIHRPQQLGNCHYVGSPFQQNWGEAGEDKRVAIVTIENDIVNLEWVPLTGYPEYRSVSLADFIARAAEIGEHRYRVVLRSQAEAATFYASPYSHLAEPMYDFSAPDPAEAVESADAWSPERTLQRYLKHNDPATKGIAVPHDEMLSVGMEILSP